MARTARVALFAALCGFAFVAGCTANRADTSSTNAAVTAKGECSGEKACAEGKTCSKAEACCNSGKTCSDAAKKN
jgi:nitrous oxide reductase accessory protein NosL